MNTDSQLSMFAPPVVAPPPIVEREPASPELTREAVATTHRLDLYARCELRQVVAGQWRASKDPEGLGALGLLEPDGSASPLGFEVVRLLKLPTGDREELGIPDVRLSSQGGSVIEPRTKGTRPR